MQDVSRVAEVVLKKMGIYPLMDELFKVAKQTTDSEYGPVDDEALEGICYTHFNLVNEDVISDFLAKYLSGANLDFFRVVSDGDLNLGIQRDSWGAITLTLRLDVPVIPNALEVGDTFLLDIQISKIGNSFRVSGAISDDEAEDYEKQLSLYTLMA